MQTDKNNKTHVNEIVVGNHIVNTDKSCPLYGAEGYVLTIDRLHEDEKTYSFCCTNRSKNWNVNDVAVKSSRLVEKLGIVVPTRLTESSQNIFSEDLLYHHRRGIPINENVFRPGSWRYFALIREARDHARLGMYNPRQSERVLLYKTDVGDHDVFEGQLVPLDFPLPVPASSLREAEYKGRDVSLGKPTKNSSGGSKYQVYVRDPKTGNVKLIRFGAGGMTSKIHDMDRRRAFGARHNCDKAKDKTKPSYWSCRLPRYWKTLGFKKPPSPGGEWW
jgi:hypothetical protein